MGVFEKMSGACKTLENSPKPTLNECFDEAQSFIAFLEYYLDIITNTDGLFPQPCYPRLNTPID